MKFRRKTIRLFILIFLYISITILGGIVINLMIAYKQTPHPQAILTLGGGKVREEFTAQFAQFYPSLPIWISSGLPEQQARRIFRDAGIATQRVHLDYRAVDTVTNFTSLVKGFKHQHYQHIFLITSNFHMPRAKAIAFIVLGS